MRSNIQLLTIVAAMTLTACAPGGTNTPVSGDARIVYQNLSSGITSSNFLLTIAATILPPTVGTNTLAADDVFVNGTNTYMTYNLPGANHMGGVDVLNTTVPALPSRTASTTFATSTVNGLYLNGSTINIVGSTNDTINTGWSAFISQLTVSGSTFSAMTNTTGLLNTYAGTGVTLWNGSLYALSGANGASTSQGLSVLNPTTLAQTATVSIADARGLNFYSSGGINSNLYVIAGGGNLYEINSSNAIVHTIVTGGNTIAESKSTVQAGKTMVAVSLGSAGAKIICQADQKTLATIPAVTVAGVDPSLTVTNSITAGPGPTFRRERTSRNRRILNDRDDRNDEQLQNSNDCKTGNN